MSELSSLAQERALAEDTAYKKIRQWFKAKQKVSLQGLHH